MHGRADAVLQPVRSGTGDGKDRVPRCCSTLQGRCLFEVATIDGDHFVEAHSLKRGNILVKLAQIAIARDELEVVFVGVTPM